MKAIYETKAFLGLEKEEKMNILQVEKEKFDAESLQFDIDKLLLEKGQIESALVFANEQIEDLEKQVDGSISDGRLAEVNVKLDELKKQSGVYKQKQAELDKYKNALEIKMAIGKKNDYEQEVQSLREEVENLHNQKVELGNSLVEIRANFDSFYASFNEEMANILMEEKLGEMKNGFAGATDDETFENYKIEQKINEISGQIEIKKEEIERFHDRCKAIKEEIAEKQEMLDNLVIPIESKENILEAKDLESEIIIYDGVLLKLDRELDQIKQDLDEAKEAYSKQLEAERKINEDVEKIDLSTAKIFDNSELNNFQKLRSCDKSLADIKIVEFEIMQADKQINSIKEKIEKQKRENQELETSLQESNNLLESKNNVVQEFKKELEDRMNDRESLLGSNALDVIIDYSRIGDKCPVCNNTIREKAYAESFDLSAINKEIELAKNKVTYAEKDRNMVVSAIATIKAKIAFNEEQIGFEDKEIAEIETSKTQIYRQVVDVNNSTSENFFGLKNALQKTANTLEDLINLQTNLRDKIQDILSKKSEQGTKISLLSEKYEELLDLYYAFQKERAEREMLMLEAKSTVGEGFDEKRETLAESEEAATNLYEELLAKFGELDEYKQKIIDGTNELVGLEKEKIRLEMNSNNRFSNSNEFNFDFEGNTKERKQKLEESYSHLLELKNNAELSLSGVLKDYDVKKALLDEKTNNFQDQMALVSSLLFRYGFADEQEAKTYITTDTMLKNMQNEITSYNNQVQKLEIEKEFLSQNDGNSVSGEQDKFEKLFALRNEKLERTKRLGEVEVLLLNMQNELEEYNHILDLIKQCE